MNTPDGSGPRWPLRTIGLVLLQLAAVALVIGVVAVVTSAGTGSPGGRGSTPDGGSAGQGAVDTAQPTTSASPPPLVIPTAAASRPPAAPPPATAAPAPAAPAPGAGQANGQRDVRVLNNSKIHGLATRAASDLSAAGWHVVEIGNYASGIIPTTTVYYQDGAQRAGAEAIASEFGMQVQPRFAGLANGAPGLVVIVTNDYRAGEQGK
jgi:hypothetical protein